MESNVQKMQKAMDKIIVITTEWQGSIPFGEVRKIAKAARKLPLRNCDVGTPQEQEKRFETFCSLHHLPKGKGCYSCPAIPKRSPHAFQRNACKINWLQMPYAPDTKKEGEQR